ncbi:hypothetical protein JW711_02255 [Candidatus Woesearchaeota archaeon]|nr:hypothetical protein [Candidatus Woesearchaeota archaeon]
MRQYDAFCEVFGYTAKNKVVAEVITMGGLDFSVGEMAEEARVSKPKTYEIIARLEKKGIVKKTRVIGKTQLYKFNKENPISKVLYKSLMACLDMVADEFSEKKSPHTSNAGVGVAMAKGN